MGAEEEAELQTKIHKLVRDKFDGAFRKGFDHYAAVHGEESKIGPSALERLLADAGVGNWLTRSLWVEGILNKLDKDKDGAISWNEFKPILDETPGTEEDRAEDRKTEPSPDS